MDYKITRLQNKMVESDREIEDFPELLFGTVPDGTIVINATEYCKKTGMDALFNMWTFMRACKPFIEGFIKAGELNPSRIFYQEPEGDALINARLTFMFLAFTSNVWMIYFDNIISDAITNGVAYSDSFLLNQAIQRIPSEILEKIIESRKKEDEQPATT